MESAVAVSIEATVDSYGCRQWKTRLRDHIVLLVASATSVVAAPHSSLQPIPGPILVTKLS